MRLFCTIFLALSAAVRLTRAACFSSYAAGEPAQPLRPIHAQTWAQLEATCTAANARYSLLQYVDFLSDAERAACGQSIVPYGVYETNRPGEDWPPVTLYWSGGTQKLEAQDLVNLTYVPHGNTEGVAVIDLDSGRWGFVSQEQTFECALCQLARVVNIECLEETFSFDDFLFFVSHQVVYEIVLVGGTKNIARAASIGNQDLLPLENELGKLFDIGPEDINNTHIATDSEGRDELYFYLTSSSINDFPIFNDRAAEVLGLKLTVECDVEYEVSRVRLVSPCPFEELPEGYQSVVRDVGYRRNEPDPKLKTFGEFQLLVDPETELLSHRDCVWGPANDTLAWTERSYWRVIWKNCSSSEQFVEDNAVQTNLRAIITRRIEKKLDSFPVVLNCSLLEDVADLVNLIVKKNNGLPEGMKDKLFSFLTRTSLTAGVEFCLIGRVRLKIIVADLKLNPSTIGFKLDLPKIPSRFTDSSFAEPGNLPSNGYFGNEDPYISKTSKSMEVPSNLFSARSNREMNSVTIHAVREALNTTDITTEFAVVASESLVQQFQHLAISVVARKVFSSNGQSEVQVYERTVHIELSTETNLPDLYLDDDDYYIDIAYPFINDIATLETETILTSCVSWNPLTTDWTKLACRKRKGLLDSLSVCRCRAKHMTQNGGVLRGAYAIKRAVEASCVTSPGSSKLDIFQYVSESNVLISLTVFECIISSVSLLSFMATAIFYKQWPEDIGHKILLHMVFAITINLALGFTTDYVHMDTDGSGCIVIGVLRHYSFLAMFMWMLVLSGLQMKRLMTVAGAKATSHLLLKVALFAWGVPLLPIVVLLAWNARIYRSDRFDRGYCYPEGVFFQVTVQAPAAFILLVNLFIFVAIVGHIFECCSGEKITKHSKNEKAQQMRRVATSIFIFFLFGFTWVLHYLSEERLIKSDFLFEYLFLITATTHISVLALFFVVLDDKARAFWLAAAKKKPYTKK